MVDRHSHLGGHTIAVSSLASRLGGGVLAEEEKLDVKQESSSVIQAVAAANRELSDRQTEEPDQEEDEAARRRRERALVRRPSYRKILTELGGHHNMISEEKEAVSESESGGSEDHSDRHHQDRHGQSPPAHHYPHHSGLRVLPSGALISNGGSVTNMESLHTLNMSGPPNGGTIVQVTTSCKQQRLSISNKNVQYTTNTENGGPFFVPTAMSSIGPSSGLGSPGHGEESSTGHRKREIRLLKNREAARECRRKKKEYIKCLENRVAVLENQNKALIEELKSLKELYTGGKMM